MTVIDGKEPASSPRFAVILRTYQWDSFIERQVARFRSVSDGGDFFISLDTTHGPIGPVSRDRVFSTTNDELVKLGLADRFEKGSLIWWNADYPAYAFHQAFPDYDYYVFVEYDSLVRQPIGPMVREMARRRLDFVAAPIENPSETYFFRHHCLLTYRAAELRASLNCISFYSNRTLAMLFERRKAMSLEPRVTSWPISEAFVATEVARASYAAGALSTLGDDGAYKWFPPFLEEDIDTLDNSVFVHPVLDPPRYLKSIVVNGGKWQDLLVASSPLRKNLSRLPKESYVPLLVEELWRRFKRKQIGRLEKRLLKHGKWLLKT